MSCGGSPTTARLANPEGGRVGGRFGRGISEVPEPDTDIRLRKPGGDGDAGGHAAPSNLSGLGGCTISSLPLVQVGAGVIGTFA